MKAKWRQASMRGTIRTAYTGQEGGAGDEKLKRTYA